MTIIKERCNRNSQLSLNLVRIIVGDGSINMYFEKCEYVK